MADGCCCTGGKKGAPAKTNVPLLCLVPIDEAGNLGPKTKPMPGGGGAAPFPGKQQGGGCDDIVGGADAQLFDNDYLKKHFDLPPRALYLDPFRRPLITFPLSQDVSKNFTMHRKQKTNQMILDGILDPSEAVMAPSIFPYAKNAQPAAKKAEDEEDEDEIIYILQLPDWEFQCPVHNQTIRTPRFVWHTCKKNKADKKSKAGGDKANKQGGGPMKRPKPWILSRITDFDLLSQW